MVRAEVRRDRIQEGHGCDVLNRLQVNDDASDAVVRTQHLNHYYGERDSRRQILFENTFALDPGEIAILTGPSGSGKTTLLTLIGALRSVQEGSAVVLGRELKSLSPSALVTVRREIGFIFQAHNLFESLTALENVLMSLALHPVPGEEKIQRAREMLEHVGLSDRMNHKPEALSGGQRQRVSIARALVTRPRLILADEPTAALDKESGRRVVELFQSLSHERGCGVLIVTHDSRILDAADRIVNMVDGRIASDVHVRESMQIVEFLMKCPVFSALTPSALSNVSDRVFRERATAGSSIIRQDDPGDRFYIIRSGSVDVVRDQAGARTHVATLGESDFFGEAALLSGGARNASVVAREDTDLYVLGKDDFRGAIDTSAGLREQLLKVYFQRQ
jgi:putative ABC transport system ATP-binding protein